MTDTSEHHYLKVRANSLNWMSAVLWTTSYIVCTFLILIWTSENYFMYLDGIQQLAFESHYFLDSSSPEGIWAIAADSLVEEVVYTHCFLSLTFPSSCSKGFLPTPITSLNMVSVRSLATQWSGHFSDISSSHWHGKLLIIPVILLFFSVVLLHFTRGN